MPEAGEVCSSCGAQFQVAYTNCPVCELDQIVNISQFDSKQGVRKKIRESNVEISDSTKRYLNM